MLRPIGTIILGIFIVGSLCGKSLPNKDSLNQIRLDPSLPDKIRFEAFEKLIKEHYQDKLPDSSFLLSKKLSEEAMEKGNLYYQAIGNSLAGQALLKQGLSVQSKTYIEQSLATWEKLDEKERMASDYSSLGAIYSREGKHDKALELLQKSIDIDFEIGDSLNSSATLLSMGRIYEVKGDVFKSLEYNKMGLYISIKAKKSSNEAVARNNLANNYKVLGDIPKSIEQYLQSRAIYEAAGNAYGLVNALNNLSVLLIDNREFEHVSAYLEEAYEISLERQLFQGQAMTHANKAYFFTAQDLLEEGLAELLLAAELITKHELDPMKPFINGEIGNVLMLLGRLDQSETYLLEGLEDSKSLGSMGDLTYIKLILSQLYTEKGELRLAMTYAQDGYVGAQSMQDNRMLVGYAGHLVDLHKAMGNNKEALRMYEIRAGLEDSLFNEENTRSLIKQEYRYTYKRQAYQDSLKNVAALNLEIEKNIRQKTVSYLLVTVLIIILLFGWVLWNRLRLIREQKQIIEDEKAKLDIANTKLKEIDDFKSRFFTNISHEFRTPLTVIGGMMGQIKTNPAKWLDAGGELIEKNVANLITLINQILDLRKLESGNLSLSYVQADVVEFLRSQTLSFLSLAEGKKVSLSFASEPSTLMMDFDSEKLLIVLTNLISNAIKFTPEGGKVQVWIGQSPVNEFLLEVKDNGIGISEEKLPFIFDRYYQVDGSHSRAGEGSGIGLSLTQELLKFMGGGIEVESEEGVGSTFKVKLPISTNAPLKSLEVHAKARTKPSSYPYKTTLTESPLQNQGLPSLLIIEDNQDVTTYLHACLEDSYRLLSAKDGEEGLALAQEFVPDLIISDVMMPKMDGYEVCNALKADERTSHIPLILLTAKADRDSRLEGLQKGADAYLTKPFDKDELYIRLEKLLELRQNLQARYSNSASDAPQKNAQFELEDSFIQKIRTAILERIDDSSFRNEDLCKRVGISRTQMHNKVKALTGKSPSHFIRAIRLTKAKEFLRESDLRITEVAYSVGFNDPSYFTRVFNKEFGYSPKEWRELQHS